MPATSPITIQVVRRLKRIPATLSGMRGPGNGSAQLPRRLLEQPRLARERHELCDGMDADFLRDRRPVHLDRALADAERCGDLLVHEPLDDLAQHLDLAPREPGESLRA